MESRWAAMSSGIGDWDELQSRSMTERVDLVCDRFEAAWKAGGKPRIEDYLPSAPDSEWTAAVSQLLAELVIIDLVYRWRLTATHSEATDFPVEETLEFLRDRLTRAGYPAGPGRRIVLTGGASQLNGMCEATRRILGGQTRAGRPIGVEGLPESAFTPAFAAVAGLLVYPQVASREYFEPRRQRRVATGTEGYVTRVSRWLRDSF